MELQNQKNTAAKRNGNEVLVTDDAIIMPDWFHEEKAEWDKPEERPLCPVCNSRVSSNGKLQWLCKTCGKSMRKKYRLQEKINKRPTCPIKGCEGKPKSHLRYWECRKCGKNWLKSTEVK